MYSVLFYDDGFHELKPISSEIFLRKFDAECIKEAKDYFNLILQAICT